MAMANKNVALLPDAIADQLPKTPGNPGGKAGRETFSLIAQRQVRCRRLARSLVPSTCPQVRPAGQKNNARLFVIRTYMLSPRPASRAALPAGRGKGQGGRNFQILRCRSDRGMRDEVGDPGNSVTWPLRSAFPASFSLSLFDPSQYNRKLLHQEPATSKGSGAAAVGWVVNSIRQSGSGNGKPVAFGPATSPGWRKLTAGSARWGERRPRWAFCSFLRARISVLDGSDP